jgi:hypothetical protein
MISENLNCPHCGGTLPPPVGKRKVKCLYCDKSLYFRSNNFVPRFTIEESKHTELKKETEKLFNSRIVNPFVKEEAVLVSRKKKFIPFYILSGKRGGVMETGKERIAAVNYLKPNLDHQNNISTGYLKNKPETIIEEDSRVILGDFRYVYEASTFDEAGLAQEEIRRSISTNINKLKAASVEELYKKGELISPNISKETIIENGVKSAKAGKDSLEILEMRLSIVYYPVEEMVFSFRDSYFSITYDLVNGKFLWGLLPCRRNLLVYAALLLSSFLGFFFGQFLSFHFIPFTFKELQNNFSFWMYFGAFIFFIFSLIFGGGLNIAYLLLKTPFGARITPDGLFLSKIAEPPKSFLSPYLKFVLKTFASGFEEALKGKRG